jgi:hypothetical protein
MSIEGIHRPNTKYWYLQIEGTEEETDIWLRRAQGNLHPYKRMVGKKRSLRNQWKGTNRGRFYSCGCCFNYKHTTDHKWYRRVQKKQSIREELYELV